MTRFMRMKLAALAAVGGMAAATQAQPPAQPFPAQNPKVIRWNGGYIVVDASGNTVVRQTGVPGGGSTNVVSGVGNGIGNRIVVDNGPGGGTTIVTNSRLGIGNKLIVNPNDDFLDLDELLQNSFGIPCPKGVPAAKPQAAIPMEMLVYKGKENTFWTKKTFSEPHDCNLYWSPMDKIWFRYTKDDDTYRPVLDGPPAPM